MTHAARSVFIFGCYVVVVGTSFLIAPQGMFRLLQLPASTDGWIRTVGLLALVIGAYDLVGAKTGVVLYLRASVFVRIGFATGVAILVATRQMPPSLLPLGLIDFAGAIWTALALRGVRGSIGATKA